jgi:hypothetical protein
MTFLNTMENWSSKKQRGSQKPTVSTIASHNRSQPETRINAAKETRASIMEATAAMKSPFAPTISSMDIQMLDVVTLEIQKESCQQCPHHRSTLFR